MVLFNQNWCLEVDALKRLQAETAGRQTLHAPLDALLPVTHARSGCALSLREIRFGCSQLARLKGEL